MVIDKTPVHTLPSTLAGILPLHNQLFTFCALPAYILRKAYTQRFSATSSDKKNTRFFAYWPLAKCFLADGQSNYP